MRSFGISVPLLNILQLFQKILPGLLVALLVLQSFLYDELFGFGVREVKFPEGTELLLVVDGAVLFEVCLVGMEHVLIIIDITIILAFGVLQVLRWRMLMDLRVFNVVLGWPQVLVALSSRTL